VEDSQAVIAHRVSDIVPELTELGLCWLNVWIEARASCRVLIVHPVAIISAASCTIADKDIIGVGDPEAARCLICIEQAKGGLGASDHIILNQILGLGGILNEDRVAHAVEVGVARHRQVVHTVDGRASIV